MLTPESKKLLQRYASAISSEVITDEGEFADEASVRKCEAITAERRNELEAHIEKLEAAAAPSPESAPQVAPKSTLGQQVAAAQAEMATWSPEVRASVRLQGGDAAGQPEGCELTALSLSDVMAAVAPPEIADIFQPVQAGTVDTSEFRKLAYDFHDLPNGSGFTNAAYGALITHIDALIAAAREGVAQHQLRHIEQLKAELAGEKAICNVALKERDALLTFRAEGIAADRAAREAPAEVPPKEGGAVYGIIDPDYGRIYTMVRKLAWEEGYAIGLHGSFTRDLDLIAVPWDDGRNCKPAKLVARILQATGMKEAHGNPGAKPHGRLVWTLLLPEFGDPRFVDLSIMPAIAAIAQEAAK